MVALFVRKRSERLDYAFTEEVVATVIYLFEWIEMPEPMLRYITVRASRIFQDRMVGSQAHHAFSQEDEVRARAMLKEFEMDTADHSIFGNYDVFNIIDRPSAARRRSL